MASRKILYVCQEIMPYLPESELSGLSRRLAQAMQERGNELRTFMPRYGCINERRNQLHEVIRLSGMNLIIDDNDHQLIIKVASIPSARIQIYFIDNDDYFARKAVLLEEQGHPWNPEETARPKHASSRGPRSDRGDRGDRGERRGDRCGRGDRERGDRDRH